MTLSLGPVVWGAAWLSRHQVGPERAALTPSAELAPEPLPLISGDKIRGSRPQL